MRKLSKFVIGAVLLVISTSSFSSGNTPFLKITELDSLAAGHYWVTLNGYTNAACDANRIHFSETSLGSDYYKEMISMLVSSFYAETLVSIEIADPCEAHRVRVRK